jgi:hypothetical protein
MGLTSIGRVYSLCVGPLEGRFRYDIARMNAFFAATRHARVLEVRVERSEEKS